MKCKSSLFSGSMIATVFILICLNYAIASDPVLKAPASEGAPSTAPAQDDDYTFEDSPYVRISKIQSKLSKYPNDPDLLIDLGSAYLQAEQPRNAGHYFILGLMHDPDGEKSNERIFNVYISYVMSNYSDDSVIFFTDYCNKLSKIHRIKKSTISNCLYYLGQALGDTGKYDKAVDIYRKALSITPDYKELIKSLADAYYFADQYKLAIANYEKFMYSESPSSYFATRGLYDSTYFGRWIRLGYCYMMVDRDQAAINALKMITDLKDEQDKKRQRYSSGKSAFTYLAGIYFQQGRYTDAMLLLQRCIDNDCGTTGTYYLYGRGYLMEKNPSQAKYAFLKSIELDGDAYFSKYFYLGNAYFELKEYDKAIEAYNKALSRNKNDAASLQNIGVCYMRQNQSIRASDYIYRAGLIHIENKDRDGALLALDNLKKADSPLYDKLYKKVYNDQPPVEKSEKRKKKSK